MRRSAGGTRSEGRSALSRALSHGNTTGTLHAAALQAGVRGSTGKSSAGGVLPTDVASVTREPTRLVVKGGGTTEYLYVPVHVLHSEAIHDTVTFVLRNPARGVRVIRVDAADEMSLRVLGSIPREDDPHAVYQVLEQLRSRSTIPDLAPEDGSLEVLDGVLTVFSGTDRWHYLVHDVERPQLLALCRNQDETLTVDLRIPEIGDRRLCVAGDDVLRSERAALFLRKAGSAATPTNRTQARWQYRIVNVGIFGTARRMQEALGTLGAQGWDLVAVLDKASNWIGGTEKGFLLLKRRWEGADDPVDGWAIFDAPGMTWAGESR